MRSAAPLLLLALLFVHCSPAADDHQSEWRKVLEYKKAAMSPSATARDKQLYADSLSTFVHRHPDHGRAREVYHRIQLEFANELSSLGRYRDAIRFYRAVLDADPRNAEARHGLSSSIDRLAVPRAKLLEIEIGMSRSEVAAIIGKPIPGWTTKNDRPSADYESWYYRTSGGGVAAVHFRDGEVFAAEEKSQARVGL